MWKEIHMKVPLNESEQQALLVGCPLCGQQKGKKCMSIRSDRLVPRPHLARIKHAKTLAAKKAGRVRATA
jgi:hypothetical protein